MASFAGNEYISYNVAEFRICETLLLAAIDVFNLLRKTGCAVASYRMRPNLLRSSPIFGWVFLCTMDECITLGSHHHCSLLKRFYSRSND